MFECCYDERNHYLEYYPKFVSDDLVGVISGDVDDKEAHRERIEDLLDLKAAQKAVKEHKKECKTHTFDDVLEGLGITREELDSVLDEEIELDD